MPGHTFPPLPAGRRWKSALLGLFPHCPLLSVDGSLCSWCAVTEGKMSHTFWEKEVRRRTKGKSAPRHHTHSTVRFGFLMVGSVLEPPWVLSTEDKF